MTEQQTGTVEDTDLLDGASVAALLGWSRSAVYHARSTYADTATPFPDPVAQRWRTKFWSRRDVEAWVEARGGDGRSGPRQVEDTGHPLRAARLAAGMSQPELAQATGRVVSQQKISFVENGQRVLSREQAVALGRVLGVPASSLLPAE